LVNFSDAMTKQALRRQKRVDAILESAVAAFRRHGYHGTSMEQIADQLLMTKGSLYYYFKDKEEILFAVHDRALDRVLAELARVRRKGGCPCQQLEDLLATHIRIMVEGFHGTALALEFGALSPSRLRQVIEKRDRYERGIRQMIERGGREGCFRSVDPKMTGMALLGAINWIARWHRADGPTGSEEVARRFLDVFNGGIRPHAPRGERSRARHSGSHLSSAGASAGVRPARRRP
jgi:AcrR family transcriptional regulator